MPLRTRFLARSLATEGRTPPDAQFLHRPSEVLDLLCNRSQLMGRLRMDGFRQPGAERAQPIYQSASHEAGDSSGDHATGGLTDHQSNAAIVAAFSESGVASRGPWLL
jgi:hypothetical protein